jgi:hypothetical protein
LSQTGLAVRVCVDPSTTPDLREAERLPEGGVVTMPNSVGHGGVARLAATVAGSGASAEVDHQMAGVEEFDWSSIFEALPGARKRIRLRR